MFVGKKLGPFAIDKELGSGAMGAVYRGIYAKTGQRVAIKVMAPGLGAKDSAAARFEREAAILKQFNHPNIVRLFGIGRYHGTPYYAMEYIEGESLDKVLARRDKLTPDEVIDYGIQLAAALQHSHEAGVIHRDLKPSNLMILKDGKTLKLTDFGIAKDTDVTALTSANCTVGTAAYMSPEQCRGADLTSKSDLYSLGIVFYELLTGKKPFEAENAMEIFIKHVNEIPGRPMHQPGCLDIPQSLDTLVNQLMEKKPEQRPLNAAMVYSVLEGIREKVEAKQSAGVDAAKKKLLDTPRGERKIEDEDRDAARTLLGGKGRLKKKRKKKTGLNSAWFQGAALVLLLASLGWALWFGLRPPAPEKLYEQAKKLMESNDPADWDKAVKENSGPITLYLKQHGDRGGKETEQMLKWRQQVELSQDERLLTNYVTKRRNKSAIKVQTQNEAEEAAFAAAWAEEEGKLKEARAQWEEMKTKYGSGTGFGRWGRIAEQHAKLAERVLGQDEAWKGDEKGMEKDAFEAFQSKSLAKFKELREAALGKEGEDRYWYLYVAYKVRELENAK